MEDSDNNIVQTISTYNKIAPGYCQKTRLKKYLTWEDKYIKKMLSYIAGARPIVLDVGCGDGRHSHMIDENGGRSIGIDLSQAMINEAESYYPEGNFQLMDMRSLAFPDNSVDGIWSCGSIYHVRKVEVSQVVAEFSRVLKPNGILAINFKLGNGEGLESNPKSFGGSPRYFAYYSKEEMSNILQNNGFSEIGSCLYPEEIFGDSLQQMWLRYSA